MKVLKLTNEQKDLLINKLYDDDSYFNPIIDADNNWIISVEERDNCVYSEFDWIKELEEIDYNPNIFDSGSIE